jgi:hypothetical protein
MKGAQYQNMPMYVIHEMEAAIVDCKAGSDGTHWEEAVAFYSGSLTLNVVHNDMKTSNSKAKGVFQLGLAEKRASDFNTRKSDDTAVVNAKVLALFESGRTQYDLGGTNKDCSAMETTKEALVKQFTVPLVQGVMKYLYLSDTSGSEKEKVCKYIYIFI